MKIKCGIDIIEIDRIKKSIESLGDAFLLKVFTQNEIDYCEKKAKNKFEHYAARFCAKEAAFKALSEEVDNKYSISWKDIETTNDKNGRPQVKINFLENDNIENIDVSLSHCKNYAVANVTVLYK